MTDAGQPLLDGATFDADGNRQFTAELTTRSWILDEHRTRAGEALLPGTGYLSIVAQALAAQGDAPRFELRDLNFLRPLRVEDGASATLCVTLPRNDTGYDLAVEARHPQSVPEVTAEGRIELLPMSAPPPLDLDAIWHRCGPPDVALTGQALPPPQNGHLAFGPRWQALQRTATGQGEGLALLSLPEEARADGWPLHPALMDMATGWAMRLIADYASDDLWVPVSYQSVRVHRDVPSQIASWVRNAADNRADGKTATFDVTIAARDGSVCVEVQGFSIRRMDGALRFARPQPAARLT